MIKINLLPQEYQAKKSKKIEIPKIEFLPVFFGVIGALVLLQCLLGSVVIYQKMTLKNINTRLKNLDPTKVAIEQMKKQISDANRRINAVEQLTQKRFLWAKKLNQLSDAIIAGIWLENLYIEEKTRQPEAAVAKPGTALKPLVQKPIKSYVLILKGHAMGTPEADGPAVVGKFMKSLKDNKEFFVDFKDIELGSIQKTNIKGVEVSNFTLNCFFNEKEDIF